MIKTISIEHRHPRPADYSSNDSAWYCRKDSSLWIYFKGTWRMLKDNILSITDKKVIEELHEKIEALYANES